MARNRIKAKGRREGGIFVPFPVEVINHQNFINLSSKAKHLLFDLASQLRFREGGTVNNGDLTASFTVMQKRGWKSRECLNFAIKELLYYAFIKLTWQGGFRSGPHLYALTFFAIDERNDFVVIQSTVTPPGDWKTVKKKWERPKRKKKIKAKLISLDRNSYDLDTHNSSIGTYDVTGKHA